MKRGCKKGSPTVLAGSEMLALVMPWEASQRGMSKRRCRIGRTSSEAASASKSGRIASGSTRSSTSPLHNRAEEVRKSLLIEGDGFA